MKFHRTSEKEVTIRDDNVVHAFFDKDKNIIVLSTQPIKGIQVYFKREKENQNEEAM